MTLVRLALSGLAAVPFVSAAVRSFDGVRNEPVTNIVPDKYLVELENSGSASRFNKRSVHDEVFDHWTKRGVSFRKRKQWTVDDIFVGLSIQIDKESDLLEIASTPGVKSIQPVRLFPAPKPAKVAGAEEYDPNSSPHFPTGVDKLHSEGILGAGVTVGVIDSGIAYNHPNLGGGFGPSFKVKLGWDFVGDDYDGTNEPVPDADPDDCGSHGSHVAGIIAASGDNPYGLIGVAPAASLASYRVFGCGGSTTDEIIIDALLRGYEDGVDVLNLSLGGPAGWTVSPSSIVASRLADKGIVVAIAAGNDGDQGAWWASSPGSGKSVVTAASTENTVLYLSEATTSTGYGPIGYSGLSSLPWPTLPVYAVSTDVTVVNDACNPLPDSTPDLSPYLVLIRRGSCTFVQKLDNVAAKGAKYFLIYNNGGAFVTPATGTYTSAMISEADGAYLVGQFAAGSDITVTFPDTAPQPYPNPEGGLISTFTSYGPTYDAFLKPSVAAPGGNILSTIPNGEFGIKSGTSMATPYTAGAAALILSKKGNNASTAKNVKKLLQTTAKYIGATHEETDPYNTLIQQGAGLIQVHNAIHYTTTVSPGEILLNDTANWNGVQVIEIENKSSKLVTYSLTHTPAGTATTTDGLLPLTSVPLSTEAIKISFSQTKVTVLPKTKYWVIATFSKPTGLDPKTLPVYTGWVTITSNTGEVTSVPYAGIAASLKNDVQIIDNSDFYFGYTTPVVLDGNSEPQTAPLNYTFVGFDYPFLLWRRAAGTRRQVVDLVPANIQIDPTYEKRWDWFGSWFPWKPTGTYAKVPVVGTLHEREWLYRHALFGEADVDYEFLDWDTPLFANGTSVPDGSYRFLLRVLKITGNPANADDYESYLSPVIGVYPSA